jgi:hypothetical protein
MDNWSVTRFLVALSTIAFLASGCGGHEQSKADKAAMNAEFRNIDFRISNWTMGPASNGEKGLERLTRLYVLTTRKYADDLGDAEVNRRLSAVAEQVAPLCPPCVEILRREAEAR